MGNEEHGGVSIFVVSDEGIPRQALVHLLRARSEYNIVGDSDLAGAESARWEKAPDIVLIHAGSAGVRAVGLIESLSSRDISSVVLLRHRTPWLVQEFHRAGAAGFVHLDGRTADLIAAINAAAAGKTFLDARLSEVVLKVPARPSTKTRELSERELQVLEYLAYGYTHAQIANKLHVSSKSVETYRARLMDKLQLHDRTELVRFALLTGILCPGTAP